ncbi:MAG TPA: hypothetical protein VJK07_00180 [Candidatus Nanoarchaeia archaeon]|nr:hypothetical protein [Candidatus Nanoarchaeia archaeon]
MIRREGLMKNFVYIVIAVIGLLVFIGGVYKLYQVGVNQESENAKKTLELIMAKVEALPEGSTNLFSFQGFSKKDWYLVGWNEADAGKPEKCLRSCLCLCKGASVGACDSREGFCRAANLFVNVSSSYLHSTPEAIEEEIASSSGGRGVKTIEVIVVQSVGCVKIPSNLFELNVSKSKTQIDISRANLKDVDPWGEHALCSIIR